MPIGITGEPRSAVEETMPDRAMTPQEMRDYMTETNIASLATLKPDGSPYLAPVWYEYAGEKLYFITGNSTVKARNILRDPRVSMAIATPGEPYKYVLIEGDAEITRSDLEMTTTSLCVRYRGEERGSKVRQGGAGGWRYYRYRGRSHEDSYLGGGGGSLETRTGPVL